MSIYLVAIFLAERRGLAIRLSGTRRIASAPPPFCMFGRPLDGHYDHQHHENDGHHDNDRHEGFIQLLQPVALGFLAVQHRYLLGKCVTALLEPAQPFLEIRSISHSYQPFAPGLPSFGV
jgi:hypothetical protein